MRIEPFRMERMQSRYENYVEFNLSESGVDPMAPGELLLDDASRAALLTARLGYSQSNGTEELRDRIATFYDGARRANVLVTNGGSEANYATLWSLLEPGDRVAYMLPNYLQTWGLSRAWARRADVFRLAPVEDGAEGRRWGLDHDGLERAVSAKTKLIMVTNPNNPTGAVLTGDEMDAIVRAARRARAWIVADEIYRGAELQGPETPSFWGRYDKVLVTSGLSKAFGLPGLRIGWVVGPESMVERIWSYRDYTTIAPGTLSDLLAREAMEPARRGAIFARTRTIVRRNWPMLEEWLAARGEILSYIAPRAGAIVLVRYNLPIASIALCERLRLEKSVLVVPGDQLGAPRHLRIGFGYGGGDGSMQGGLRRIDELLRAIGSAAPARRRAVSGPGASGRRRSRPRGR
ncbi:MAG TPA: aminotransferase class I/II-fold pyridoxal phosphate-dependent enzyme [Patescibacteria group bacterium]|nr:aminotransferase class I/II-fold pyridoxal phosphate-dependent enzyme [Patescibacteria group bacterium]